MIDDIIIDYEAEFMHFNFIKINSLTFLYYDPDFGILQELLLIDGLITL